MSLLVYGVVSSETDPRRKACVRLPRGVDDAPVHLVKVDQLGAIVSLAVASGATVTVPRALAYARVIDRIHADRAIVPMRYGCVLRESHDVVDLLRARAEDYARLLQAVDGCVEMSIRLLSDRPEPPPPATSPSEGVEVSSDMSARSPGMAYLTRRRRIYDEQEKATREAEARLEGIRAALSGWFVTCKVEHPQAASVRPVFAAPAFALHFLLKREWVSSFRHVFGRFDPAERRRLLLSGPWPPYNFVEPERGIDTSRSRD